MNVPIDKLSKVFKAGASAKKESDTPVRVSIYLDSTATDFLIDTMRTAFVPQTTAGIVRVERLGSDRVVPKTDTDVVLVLTSGSDRLESAVQEIVIGGAPVCVVAESSVEVPFITESTPMLGLVAATDKVYLLETLARWILDRTEKDTAFAANFPFMRIAASNRIITSCALTNMATGALVFIPGADLPVMLVTQAGMLMELAAVYGKPIKAERGYEVAGIIAAGYVMRGISRMVVKQTPHIAFLVKAVVAATGTYAMGKGLVAVYQRDIDYSPLNDALSGAFSTAKQIVTGVAGAVQPNMAADETPDA